MILSNEKIIELIDSGTSDQLRLSTKRAKKLNMHITGKNVVEYLETLDDYETYAQKILREKLVKTNRSLFSFILRPTDKIFTATGGAINYNLTQDEVSGLKTEISADGLEIKRYLKKVVKKQYVIDPNGVLFVDIDAEGKLETDVINSKDILWYKNRGNVVEAIIFQPFKKEGDENKDKRFYRVIDQEKDYIYVDDGSNVSLDDEMDNFFGYVPALIMGDEKDPNNDIFESMVADIVDDADEMLRDMSVKTVHKLSHAYPRYWSYAQACIRCEGEGQLSTNTGTVEEPVTETSTCPSCGGDGQKKRTNPSDEMVLQVPQDGETKIAPEVAGFVSPDISMMKFYQEMEGELKNSMFQATWGTTYEGGGKRETATGRFLDAQPVQDRLRDISYTFAGMHQFLLDAYGKVLLVNPNYESSVSYGTRYILESPDDILDKYIEGSRENISEVGILDLRNRYFEAEYQNDPLELSKKKKLAKIEPFPTMKVNDVLSSDIISDEDKLSKAHYSSWASTLTDAQLIFMSEKKLRESLAEYVSNKTVNSKTSNNE